MKYKKYPGYRGSGVEWLGEIPEHWNNKKHKYVSTFYKGKNPSKLYDEEQSETKKYLSMDYLRGFSEPLYGKTENNSYVVHKGQPLIIWDGSNSGEFVLGRDGILSSTMAAAVLTSKNIDKKFYWYICKDIEPEMRKHSIGMGIPHVNGNELKNIKVVQPPIKEQQQIANYLDTATAKIDTLIQKQEKLVELLKEKRQAVISHAVTKGLDPDVNMKDSGVEWLGEVPEHWEVSLLKYHTIKVTDGAHISPDLNNGKHYFVSVKDTTSGTVKFCDALLTSDESYKYLVRTGCKPHKGDILLGKDGTIGVTSIVETDVPFVVASSLIIIRPSLIQNSNFINYSSKSNFFQEQINSFVKGAGLKRLSIQNLLKIKSIFPPSEEQQAISDYLDDKTSKINKLVGKATKSIELLKEKRTALISSAVTGKIDIREIV